MNSQRGNTPDHFSRRRNLEELLRFKNDDSGYIEGKVFMVWPPRNRLHRINLEVAQDSALYRFEVEIPHKDEITFRPHERICFALKGMRIDSRKESSAPHCFPIVLHFPDGVVFKYLSGANAGKVVDTREGNTDEWYKPGMVPTVSDTVTTDAFDVCHGPVLNKISPDRPSALAIAVPDAASVQLTRPAQQPSTERSSRSSKTRPRKKRRLHRERESTSANQLATDTNGSRPVAVAVPCAEQRQTFISGSLIDVSDSHPKLCGDSRPTDRGTSVGADLSHENNHRSTVTVAEEAGVPALRLKAGVCTQRGDIFTALGDLQKGHSMINVIGIVASVNPERKTKTKEWSRSFTLVDPSTVDSMRQTVTVNCFQKKYPEWLPQVRKDDIVILRKLKVVEFNGSLVATGYNDKLRWAVYDPLGHSIRPPDKGSAPEKELTDDGLGYEYSPYWEPFQDSTELEYCRQIGEWWRAKQGFGGQNVPVVQCSASRKQHLLVSQVSPDIAPKGFFNCTVEVLQKFNNHGSAMTIYVTDYTANALVHPVQASWCPSELSDRVLQCHMWDDARNIAKTMKPGEYWYLYNVRAKWNPGNYLEATMQLAEKVTRLDETNLEGQAHLRALLARKNGLGLDKTNPASRSASTHLFPEMLLQDVEGSTNFLTCVVELLHSDLNSRGDHFIYVTDYTCNPDLPTTASPAGWAQNLEHCILKIKLDDAQAKISLNHHPGSVVIIRNLRIKRLNASGSMFGCLGGEDTLIQPLHDSSSQGAQTLHRNKEKWERKNMLDNVTMLPNGSHENARAQLRSSPTLLNISTLQDALTRPHPDTFRMLARVMDFFPFSLEDACVVRCTKCGSSPPPSFKRCPRCDDMVETHCKWFYRLFILLQDESGSELIVSLSGKECTLLQDVDPADFHCDQVTFCRFLAKLDPILGNLRDVHEAWSRNEHKVIESPLMAFTIESWNIEDQRGYGLLHCAPHKQSGLQFVSSV